MLLNKLLLKFHSPPSLAISTSASETTKLRKCALMSRNSRGNKLRKKRNAHVCSQLIPLRTHGRQWQQLLWSKCRLELWAWRKPDPTGLFLSQNITLPGHSLHDRISEKLCRLMGLSLYRRQGSVISKPLIKGRGAGWLAIIRNGEFFCK